MVPLSPRHLKIRVATADRDESYVSRDRSKLYRRGYSERERERKRERVTTGYLCERSYAVLSLLLCFVLCHTHMCALARTHNRHDEKNVTVARFASSVGLFAAFCQRVVAWQLNARHLQNDPKKKFASPGPFSPERFNGRRLEE